MERILKLKTIHHIAIIVSDYEKSRDFYVNKLGFEIIRENHRPKRHDYKLDLRCGTAELEIFGNKLSDPHYTTPPKRIGRPEYDREACGLRHLAFYVDDVEVPLTDEEKAESGLKYTYLTLEK